MGLGFDKLNNESDISFWILDLYTLVSVPLFAIFISHLALEIDILDQEAYTGKLVREVFNRQDLKLLEIFDNNDTSSYIDGYGTKEYYLLLIIRLKDVNIQLMEIVNNEYTDAKVRKISGIRDNDLSDINMEYTESDSLINKHQYL